MPRFPQLEGVNQKKDELVKFNCLWIKKAQGIAHFYQQKKSKYKPLNNSFLMLDVQVVYYDS